MLINIESYKKERLGVYHKQLERLASFQKRNFETIGNLWNDIQDDLNKKTN